MNRPNVLCAITALVLTCSLPAAPQEKGGWRPASTTALGITGDVVFSGQKIAINYASFTIAQIRELTPAEISAVFNLGGDAKAGGNLYRTSIPATKLFLHKNTLCGSEDTQWIATYAVGHSLQLAFFSGPQMPVFTPEAMAGTTDLCGTYAYVR